MAELNLGRVVGENGKDGQRGSKWYTGTGISGKETIPKVYGGSGVQDALANDMYLNNDNGEIYSCVAGGNPANATWKYEFNMMADTVVQSGYQETKNVPDTGTILDLSVVQDRYGENDIYISSDKDGKGYLYNLAENNITGLPLIAQLNNQNHIITSAASDENGHVFISNKDSSHTSDILLSENYGGNFYHVGNPSDFSITVQTPTELSNYSIEKVRCFNNQFVMVGGNGTNGGIFPVNTIKRDGVLIGYDIQFVHVNSLTSGNYGTIYDVIENNGLWVAVGQQICTSSDGINWTSFPTAYEVLSSSNTLFGGLKSIAYGGGMFLAVGSGGGCVISNNGTSFDGYRDGEIYDDFTSVIYSQNMRNFLVGCSNGKIYTTLDGKGFEEFIDLSNKGGINSLHEIDGNLLVGAGTGLYLIERKNKMLSDVIIELYNNSI